MTVQVGPVSIEVTERFQSCRGKPMGGEEELDGKRLLAYMRTPDGGDIHVGFTKWADGLADVVGLVKVSGPDVYERLTKAGRMQVAATNTGHHSVRLQALRYKEPGRANLASVTWDDLNKLLDSNASEILKSFGAIELGTAEEILNVTNRTRNQLAMVSPQGNHEALFAAYALTRILPLMKNFGIAQVSAI
jgi:hypothetical protein